MALREPIQSATMEVLGIDWLPEYRARVVPSTQLLEITVTDTNPQRAQIIAKELANQLILQSPTIGGTETGERQDFIKEQLSNLQNQIQETEKKIEELQKSLVGLTSASQIANIKKDISEQTARLDDMRTNYASFLANSQEGAVNILTVLEPANLPTHSVGTSKLTIILLAGIFGFSLGTGAAYLLEYLDRTVKRASDVERIFNLPVIGFISEMPKNGSRTPIVSKKPNSILAENFRMLRSNIEFYNVVDPIKTLLITSPSPGNGKTTIASNLAVSISQTGQEVILVDADLRRSAVHSYMRMTKAPGLSDLLNNKAKIQNVLREWKKTKNLKVITAGNKFPNITEVVGSKRIAMILAELKKNHELVIVDAPPLIIADAYNLASSADGVLIVLEPGQTTDDQAKTIKEQLQRANAKLIGVVFNKVTEASEYSYGDFKYRSLYSAKHYGEYTSNAKKKPAKVSRSKGFVDFIEHGKVPTEMMTDVENAIAAIKTQPQNILRRFKKDKKED
jgi:capsular exopolysaccharide synthesis family protein